MKLTNTSGKPPAGGELHPACNEMLQQVLSLEGAALSNFLETAEWPPNAPKTELQRWMPALNKFDIYMENALREENGRKIVDQIPEIKNLMEQIFRFSWLIYENTFSRSVYSSVDRLIEFLDSEDICFVTKTLAFLLTISKRSRFGSQIQKDLKKQLGQRLFGIILCWDGQMSGVKMNRVCDPDFTCKYFPLHMNIEGNKVYTITEPNYAEKTLADMWEEVQEKGPIDEDEEHLIRAGIRMAYALRNYEERLHVVIARLMAFSILAYSRICLENPAVQTYLKTTLVDDIGLILHRQENFENPTIDKLKGEALRTLTSMVLIDKQSRLRTIVEATGANTYHGYVSVVTRICVDDLKANLIGKPGHMSSYFATALFSLLYHIAGNDTPANHRLAPRNADLAMSSSIMDALLDAISCDTIGPENIGFLTRAIRVVDIITLTDANTFNATAGIQAAVNRFVMEVKICKQWHESHTGTDPCNHQRAALIKSLLNFLKQSVADQHFADACRPIMDGDLPDAITEVLDNAHFYGASLFYNAVCLVTSFVYQEPTKLTHLQDKGVCDAMMKALFRHETPINRDMISHIPSTISALCLNERGLENVKNFKPFEKIIDMVLSTKFMTLTKKKKSGMIDFAPSLGNALDELLRHQPSLRGELYKALTNAVDRIREMAENTNNKLVYHCSTAIAIKNGEIDLTENSNPASPEEPDPPRNISSFPTHRGGRLQVHRNRRNLRNGVSNNGISDDEDDDDDCNLDTATSETLASTASSCEDAEILPSEGFTVGDICVVPIGEYATYMTRVIETMVCPGINSENARLFIDLGVVQKLIKLLCTRRACIDMHQNGLHVMIANIVKTLLLNGYNTAVLEEVLKELHEVTAECSKYDIEKTEFRLEDMRSGTFLVSPKKEVSKIVMEDICSVGSVVQVLMALVKRPVMTGQSNDIRALLMKHFLNSQYGKPSMDNIATWFRLLTWELCAWQAKMTETKEEKLEGKRPKKGKEIVRDMSIPTIPLVCEPENVIITPNQTSNIAVMAKIQKLVAEVQCTMISSITDITQKRFVEKMSSDCPKAYILIDETFKSVMDNLQWEGLKSAKKTRNVFRAAMIDFLRIIFLTEQTVPYFALITRFHASGHYEVFCNCIKDLDAQLDSPGIIHLVEAWFNLTILLNNCKYGKGKVVKIPKQQEYMFGNDKVDIKTFLQSFRSKTYECIMSVYSSLNERKIDGKLKEHQARIMNRCLAVYTDVLCGIVALNKPLFDEDQEEDTSLTTLAVTDETATISAMGFTDRQSNIALRMFGRTEQAANFLSQYAGHENKPARLPSAEEIRKRKNAKKSEPNETEKPKEKDKAALETNKYLLSNACDLILQLYLNFAEGHSFVLVGIAKFLDMYIQELDREDQRNFVERIFMQKIFDLVDETARSTNREEETASLDGLVLRMRLMCLLWPKLPPATAGYLINPEMVQKALKLFRYLDFRKHSIPSFAKVMSLLILLFDLAEKTAVFENRRKMYCQSVAHSKWKYWNHVNEGFGSSESTKSSWVTFPKELSDTLDERYRSGYEFAKNLKVGDGLVSFNFTDMVVDVGGGIGSTEIPLAVEVTLKKSVDMKNVLSQEYRSIFDVDEKRFLLDTCLQLLHSEYVDTDCIHSMLAFIARLTKDYTLVPHFIEANGLENVFSLTCRKSVSLSPLYVTFIIRHCLDDEMMLAQSFEKIIKAALRGGNMPNSGNYPGPGFAGRWYRPREGRTREWFHVLHNLAPMGASDPLLLARVFEKVTTKNNNTMEIAEGATFTDMAIQSGCVSHSDEVVRALLKFILKKKCGDDEQLLINRSFLLRNLAELTKNYSCVASSLVDYHEEEDVFAAVIKMAISPEERNISSASRAFLMTIASATHSPQVQKALIASMQECIASATEQENQKKAVDDIQEIANLILQIRDACPPNSDVSPETLERQGNHNAVFWTIVESGILNDLVNSVWKLKRCGKEDITKVAASIIRTVEELSRHSMFVKKREQQPEAAPANAAVEAAEEQSHDGDPMAEDDHDLPPLPDQNQDQDQDQDVDFNFADELDLGMMLELGADAVLDPSLDPAHDPEELEPAHRHDDNPHDVDLRDRPHNVNMQNHDDVEDEDDDHDDDDDELMEMDGAHEQWYGDALDDDDDDDGDGFGLDDLDDDPDLLGDEEDLSQVDGLLEEVLEDMERESGGDYDHRLGGNVYIFDTVRMSRNDLMRNAGARGAFANEFVNGSLGDMQVLYSRAARADNSANEFISTANAGDGALPYMSNPLYRQAVPRASDMIMSLHMGVEPRSISPEWLLSRAVFEPSGFSGFGRNRRAGPSLHRQNAVRRYPPSHMFGTSTLDDAFIDFRLRDGRDYMGEGQARRKFGMGGSKPAAIPTALERFIDSSRIFDPKSVTYVFALLCAYYTAEPLSKMSSVRYWSLSGEDRTQEVENEGEETPKLKHKGKEITVLPELRFERDMPSARTEVIIPQDVFERVEATVSMRRPSAQPESSADSSDRPGPSGTAQQLDEQLREILGDLEIPDGVDPAFLAALPEDMRREVIRDHLRQQGRVSVARSQPAESVVGVPAVVNENADGEGDDANANLPPPLDQEFLAALPPELQQELIEQHERDVRLAREAQNPPSNPPVEEPVDPGALLESLPPSLRAQVLADADDSVIQVLPQNFADEARRLRANLEQQQAMRYARMMNPRSTFPRNPLNYARPDFGGSSDSPTLNTVQFLNAEAITTVLLFLLLDDGKVQSLFPTNKLVKLIRNLCTHAPSCDYIIRSLTQFIKGFPTDCSGFDDVKCSERSVTWLEKLAHDCGIGRNERIVTFPEGSDSALVNPRAIPTCAKNILEALQNIARAYPTQFLPQDMRSAKLNPEDVKPADFDFFRVVKSMNECGEESLKELSQIEYPAFSEAPIAELLVGLGNNWIQGGNVVHERLLRICYLVFHKIPDNAIYDKSIEDLEKSLSCVVKRITEQNCSAEAVNDGRSLLSESARAFGEEAKDAVFKLLMKAIESLGLQLLPELVSLDEELSKTGISEEGKKEGESREGVQSTAIKLSSMKLSRQKELLKALESMIAIRTNVREMEKIKKKKAEAKKPEKPTTDAANAESGSSSEAKEAEKEGESSKAPSQEPEKPVEDYVALSNLDQLWDVLSSCLTKLEAFSGQRAVVTLQAATEAFFLVYTPSDLPTDLTDYLKKHSLSEPNLARLHTFAESHRRVLNQILRVSGSQLMETNGSFRVLMLFSKMLDFDVKRKFFRKEIHRRERDDRTFLRRDDVGIRVRRSHLFSDSFRELFRLRANDWKSRFYVVFEGEEGQDAGGLLREWFSIITREIFNPNYALFTAAPGDRATYMINKTSYINPEHLDYFKFVGKIIAKAIYENKLLDCYFTRAFYKHILNLPVRYQDIESEDPSYYKSLEFLLTNPVEHVADLTFSVDVDEFGVVSRRQLKEDGCRLPVTDENKDEYVQLVCQMKMTGSIRKQLDAFLEGFYEIIPKQLISIFNEQELELLISGLPTIDIDDLCAHTEYKTYTKSSPQIQWFWRALRSFEREDLAKFLQFVTGTSKVPLQGFANLEGMNGVQKFSIHCDFRSNDRLPAAHTCFNQLDLPQYENYEKLHRMLLLAIRECTEGFGFA
ncbi:hypothetical protein QR680_002591 [Steinernema hermaphroditum]|uniref:HECT-type E3 ubiquitin transferase n=1 Tax=Steinernema hermaphroditum TaxID=289476 RepID=A0AA39LIG6_9BILA|nr:hypothetical protein QR680_002591 [Steinernema hermaphroditum]